MQMHTPVETPTADEVLSWNRHLVLFRLPFSNVRESSTISHFSFRHLMIVICSSFLSLDSWETLSSLICCDRSLVVLTVVFIYMYDSYELDCQIVDISCSFSCSFEVINRFIYFNSRSVFNYYFNFNVVLTINSRTIEMKKKKSTSFIVTLNSKNFHVWLKELRGLADLFMIWKYIDFIDQLERSRSFEFSNFTNFVVSNVKSTINDVTTSNVQVFIDEAISQHLQTRF